MLKYRKYLLIEKNLIDDKVKHRIRNTMEIFFKTFILNKNK